MHTCLFTTNRIKGGIDQIKKGQKLINKGVFLIMQHHSKPTNFKRKKCNFKLKKKIVQNQNLTSINLTDQDFDDYFKHIDSLQKK